MTSFFPTQARSVPPSAKHMSDSLEAAAEQLMVLKDFGAAFATCSTCLEELRLLEDDPRSSELKAGFCVVGIQALAEMNQWPGVLSWVLRQYETPELVPARILQMCLVLYSKVGGVAQVQEAAAAWLQCESNRRASGFRTVAELYLLHVLVPLGWLDQARQLVLGEVGSDVFTEEQKLTALELVEQRESRIAEPAPSPEAARVRPGSLIHQLESVVKVVQVVYRRLLLSSSGSLLVHRLVLGAALLYMLFLRLDPALPSSFMFISKLLHLLKHTWDSVISLHSPTHLKTQ